MAKRKPLNPRQIERERLLFRYSMALERGDFETVSAVLRLAEQDPLLDRMIHELDEAYALELQPAPTLFSTNHVDQRKEHPMTTIAKTRTSVFGNVELGTRNFSPLAAAVVAVILFGMALIGLRPPGNLQPAAIIQNASATPLATLTFTPTPVAMVQGGTATPIPSSISSTICEVFSLAPDGIDVYSRPELDALVVGHVPAGVPLAILDQANGPFSPDSPDSIVWFYVSALVNRVPVQGWVSTRYTTQISTNCLLTATIVPALPANIDPFALTATAIIAGATGTAEVVTGVEMSGAAPTVVPPCTNIEPVAPGLVNCLNVSATPISTPTSMFFSFGGQGVMTAVQVGSIPPNTPVIITSGYFDGAGWVYSVQTVDGAVFAEGLRDEHLTFIPGYVLPTLVPTLTATPTAMFLNPTNPSVWAVQTVTQVGTIPANTMVLVGSAYYNGQEWIYSVSEDGINYAEARESQLSFGAGSVVPTAVMPISLSATPIPLGLCTVINASQSDIDLRTQPSGSPEVALAGHLPAGEMGEVQYLMMRSGRQIWYYLHTNNGNGWVSDAEVMPVNSCPSLENGAVGTFPNQLPTVPPPAVTATPLPILLPTFTPTPVK